MKLSTSQVARLLGLSQSRVQQLARAGKLRHEWTALGRLYDRQDVERYAAECDARAAAPRGGK